MRQALRNATDEVKVFRTDTSKTAFFGKFQTYPPPPPKIASIVSLNRTVPNFRRQTAGDRQTAENCSKTRHREEKGGEVEDGE